MQCRLEIRLVKLTQARPKSLISAICCEEAINDGHQLVLHGIPEMVNLHLALTLAGNDNVASPGSVAGRLDSVGLAGQHVDPSEHQ